MPSRGSILLAASAAGLLATQVLAQELPPLPTASNCKPIYPQVCVRIEGEWSGPLISEAAVSNQVNTLVFPPSSSLRNPAAPLQCACATAADISCLEISNIYSQVANVSGADEASVRRPINLYPTGFRSTFTANTTEAT